MGRLEGGMVGEMVRVLARRVEEGRAKRPGRPVEADADARLVHCAASHLWGREAGHSAMAVLAIGERGCRGAWREWRVRRARRARCGVPVGWVAWPRGRGGAPF